VSAGEMLKLEGNIIGEPPADVTWKKESERLETAMDKSMVITNVPYNTKLVIRFIFHALFQFLIWAIRDMEFRKIYNDNFKKYESLDLTRIAIT
jgi:hypothetical protein